jgi:shikimate dehydrogenase
LRFVLLGHPVAHSMSPAIHQAAYAALGLPHRYELFDAPAEADVAAAVQELRASAIAGANVTIPWKRVALRLADSADRTAAEVGAANVLVRTDAGQVVAYNTDVPALQSELLRLVSAPRRVVVIGSGGAALAAVAAARALGAEVGVVARRFRPDAGGALPASEEFVRLGARALPWPEPLRLAELDAFLKTADLVVQASSAGMHGASGGDTVANLVRWSEMPQQAAAYDLVYNPTETAFLRAARAAGRVAEGGLGMLVGQARAAIKLWLGDLPPPEPLLAAAQRALAARGA